MTPPATTVKRANADSSGLPRTAQVMVDLCVIPIGVGVSLSEYIAECQKVLEGAGLKHEMHAYGTIIEGEWGSPRS